MENETIKTSDLKSLLEIDKHIGANGEEVKLDFTQKLADYFTGKVDSRPMLCRSRKTPVITEVYRYADLEPIGAWSGQYRVALSSTSYHAGAKTRSYYVYDNDNVIVHRQRFIKASADSKRSAFKKCVNFARNKAEENG